MGRASSSKKVARAASTGGGRTARGARPIGWYAAITLVVVLGVAGIVFSRAERRQELAAGAGAAAPVPGKDHWHAAYGFYLCDSFAPNIPSVRGGLHTHDDGLIHAEPLTRREGGANATLARFLDQAGAKLTNTAVATPGGKTYTEGKTKCGGADGVVQVKVDGKVRRSGFDGIRLADRQVITIAFVAAGADIPDPSSVSTLAEQGSPGATMPPAEGSGAPTTAPAAEGEGASTTVAPAGGDTTTTAAP